MNRYTFFLEFKGGTYLQQIRAKSLKNALYRWFFLLETEPLPRHGKKIANDFFNNYFNRLEFNPPSSPKQGRKLEFCHPLSPIKGMKSVWCFTASVRNKIAFLHVVCCKGRCK